MDRIIASVRTGVASLLLASVGSVAGFGATPGIAAPFSGLLAPTIFNSRADLNGNGVVNASDDSNAFYGLTSIIDGRLDCNAWLQDNEGLAGDGTIDAADDCTLIGYDTTADGITITVADGEFTMADADPSRTGSPFRQSSTQPTQQIRPFSEPTSLGRRSMERSTRMAMS